MSAMWEVGNAGMSWAGAPNYWRWRKIGGNEIKHFHSAESWFLIINDLGGICIVKQELFNRDRKISLRAQVQLETMDTSSTCPMFQPFSNGTSFQFQLCIFVGVVNIQNLIEAHWTESKTYSFLCLQIYFERWTAGQLTHRWRTYRSTC